MQTSFLDTLVPANYWLSKSMEFTKRNSCGTLWYLKKWFVYYYYVFLKDNLFDADYQEIIKHFNDFISSLHPDIQQEAIPYFFEIDIRQDNFSKLQQFLTTSRSFLNENDQFQHTIHAKKFYFMYLMNLGGQSGYKKHMKELIAEGKTFEQVKQEITNIILSNGDNEAKVREQISDFPAAIRNERQIFFYYGFFHGRDNADLTGFYNLTFVGNLVIKANFHELILIWEHQKLKMVSQSPLADIQNLNLSKPLNIDNFGTLNHPYFILLDLLKKRNCITTSEYQYIIARIKNSTNLEEIEQQVLGHKEVIQIVEDQIKQFGRKADLEDEDFLKELKKLILGICDMPKDGTYNYFKFLSWVDKKEIKVLNAEKANFVVENYRIFCNYLDEIYVSKYTTFETTLKAKYATISDKKNYQITDSDRYDWYKYVINFDKNLLLHLIYLGVALQESNFEHSLSLNIFKNYFEKYQSLCLELGIKRSQFHKILADIQNYLKDNDFYKWENENASHHKEIKLQQFNFEINIEKLNEISQQSPSYATARKRNSTLIDSLRSFYVKSFSNSDTKLITCECCKESTFLTSQLIPYIEFHHFIPFSTEFGPDHYLNLFGLCPNCHRKVHFAQIGEKENLYSNISTNNHLKINLLERMKKLYQEKLLLPIHLDFLKRERVINGEEYEQFTNTSFLNQ